MVTDWNSAMNSGEGKSELQQFEKYFVAEDVYTAKILEVSEVFDAKVYQGKENETMKKLTFTFNVEVNKEIKKLPMFVSASVRKGSGTYQNSKLYDIIEKAGLNEKWGKEKTLIASMKTDEEKWKATSQFLRDNLIERQCRVLTKTVKKDDPQNKYSVVGTLFKFI